MNLQLAFKILNHLYQKGVRTFCIAPGGRNAPFVEILSRSHLSVFYFYDERSMAFFAHGRSRRDGAPVAVITTSGTAVCELLPAVVESHYSLSSLVLITADRPAEYKGTGAPQVIEQEKLFSNYVSLEKSFSVQDFQNEWDLSNWNTKESIHLNVHFDEPLIEEDFLRKEIPSLINQHWPDSKLPSVKTTEASLSDAQKDDLWLFFQSSSQPVILLSSLPYDLKDRVEDALLNLNCPIYAEPLSQLRESPKLQKLILKSGYGIFKKAFDKKLFDGVIRIGGIPVSRFWRDLNEWNVPVLSLSLSSFSGLKKRSQALPLLPCLDTLDDFKGHKESDPNKFLTFDSTCKSDSTEEGRWVQWLSDRIPESSFVFLGNSLPIREWNQFATRKYKKLVFSGNRGANGIDGLISSFLGECRSDVHNCCILGDLSSLYDFSAPWVLKQMKNYRISIFVINNFGGQIFKSHFQNQAFFNSHQLDFSHFAHMWNLNYRKIKNWTDTLEFTSHDLIEVIPEG